MTHIVYRGQPGGKAYQERRRSLDEPSATISAFGYGSAAKHQAQIVMTDDEARLSGKETKPPYRIPSMAEIAAVPWNGMRVISTFAGAGGSSLGYRMAGFRVVWSNEFVDAAREVYAANAAPGTVVDGRDIRKVDPLKVLKTLGMRPGELDVLDGSPPCASFSTAGKREKHWGEEKAYSDTKQRTDDLFFEYARILKAMQPRAFVAENVSGLVKGVAKGYFLEILAALKACGYQVEARLLDAQWLGVPQQRQRIIFVGARADLDVDPAFPKPLPYRYSVRDALPWLAALRGGNKAPFDSKGKTMSLGAPCPTVIGGDTLGLSPFQFEVEDESDISGQAIGREYDRLNPGEASDKYFNLVRSDAASPAPTITASGGQNSGIACAVHPSEKRKFAIAELKRICGFPDDFVLTGTYAQQWERLGRAVPPPMMFQIATAVRGLLSPSRTRARPRRSPGRSTSGSGRTDAGTSRRSRRRRRGPPAAP